MEQSSGQRIYGDEKVCVGFLYKKGGQLCFTDKEAHFYSLELACEVSGTSQLTACLKADGMGSGGEPGSSLVINMNPVENRIKELSVIVKYRDDAELPESAELKIKAKFCNAKEWKETFSLTLYRNPESSLDDFKQNQGKKDTDFLCFQGCLQVRNRESAYGNCKYCTIRCWRAMQV